MINSTWYTYYTVWLLRRSCVIYSQHYSCITGWRTDILNVPFLKKITHVKEGMQSLASHRQAWLFLFVFLDLPAAGSSGHGGSPVKKPDWTLLPRKRDGTVSPFLSPPSLSLSASPLSHCILKAGHTHTAVFLISNRNLCTVRSGNDASLNDNLWEQRQITLHVFCLEKLRGETVTNAQLECTYKWKVRRDSSNFTRMVPSASCDTDRCDAFAISLLLP